MYLIEPKYFRELFIDLLYAREPGLTIYNGDKKYVLNTPTVNN